MACTSVRKVMLFSHDAHPQMVTGAEKALLQLGEACQNHGWSAAWVSPRAGLATSRAAEMGFEVRVEPFPLLWSLIHEPHRVAEAIQLLNSFAEQSPLHQVILDFQPDLIVANSAINGLPAFLASARKIPLWWYIHEIIPGGKGMGPLLSLLHSCSDRILVPSADVEKSVSRKDQNPQKVVRLPYFTAIPPYPALLQAQKSIRHKFGWTNETAIVGWFGAIYPGKGLLEAIKSLSCVSRIDQQVVLAAAGTVVDPVYFQTCLDEARQNRCIDFQYLGVFSDIEQILPAVDIVVIPSLVEEAFPNIALEAMACGKCIAAYRSGGLKELVIQGETGYLSPKGDCLALGAFIRELLPDPVKRMQMGKKGREAAGKTYTKEIFYRQIREMLSQLMPAKRQAKE
ncbi:glycosyltransferase family 4 protein [Brevibacillus borstelensis]|uniref:glycosyltransferase family 4 protein n=1 Tax=Brevibacillus borstelensis TaxID=45462 RepID=UPI0030C2142B